MNEVEQAAEVLRETLDQPTARWVEERVASGAACWALDPYVPGVVGCMERQSGDVLAVVYLAERDVQLGRAVEEAAS